MQGGNEKDISGERCLEVHAAWRNRWDKSEHCGGPGLFCFTFRGTRGIHFSYIESQRYGGCCMCPALLGSESSVLLLMVSKDAAASLVY